MDLSLTLLTETFTLHRLLPDAEVPAVALRSPFCAITRTDDELSIILPEGVEIQSDRSDLGWSCFKVEGPLDFGLVGVLAGLAHALAEAEIPVFAISTFDTDYILVKREQVEAAKGALTSAGYQVAVED